MFGPWLNSSAGTEKSGLGSWITSAHFHNRALLPAQSDGFLQTSCPPPITASPANMSTESAAMVAVEWAWKNYFNDRNKKDFWGLDVNDPLNQLLRFFRAQISALVEACWCGRSKQETMFQLTRVKTTPVELNNANLSHQTANLFSTLIKGVSNPLRNCLHFLKTGNKMNKQNVSVHFCNSGQIKFFVATSD